MNARVHPSAVLFVPLIALFGVGCPQTQLAFTTADMAGLVAEVDVDNERVTLSRGAALIFDCTETTELWQGPCRAFSFEVDDDEVAELLQAHPNRALAPTTTVSEQEQERLSASIRPTRAVLLGLEAGTTDATVSSESSVATFEVVVIEPSDAP